MEDLSRTHECRKKQYACAPCGATDEVKLWDGDMGPIIINCHKCGAGQGMELKEQMAKRVGMLPTDRKDIAIR